MRAPYCVLRGAFVFVAVANAGCVRFRRGSYVVIVAMRRNGQQLGRAHEKRSAALELEAGGLMQSCDHLFGFA
jgi:hypothetical protein